MEIFNKIANFIPDYDWKLFSGGMAGAISKTFVAPIERVIILKQTNNQKYSGSLFRIIPSIYRYEGVKGLFKGNGANVLRVAPYQALEFYIFDFLRRKLLKKFDPHVNRNVSNLLFGGVSGLLATSCVYPFNFAKTILAVQTESATQYKGIFHTLGILIKQKGLRGMYQGLSIRLLGMVPWASFKLTSVAFFRRNLDHRYKIEERHQNITNMIFGGLGGCMALTCVYPIDVISRRFQVECIQQDETPHYKDVIAQIYKESNWRGFYRGLVATYIKVIPAVSICVMTNERIKAIRTKTE